MVAYVEILDYDRSRVRAGDYKQVAAAATAQSGATTSSDQDVILHAANQMIAACASNQHMRSVAPVRGDVSCVLSRREARTWDDQLLWRCGPRDVPDGITMIPA